jgi:hypothetical protein
MHEDYSIQNDPGVRFPFGFKERAVTDEPLGKSKNRAL